MGVALTKNELDKAMIEMDLQWVPPAYSGGGEGEDSGGAMQDRGAQVSHLLIYQSPACFTDPLTILTAV